MHRTLHYSWGHQVHFWSCDCALNDFDLEAAGQGTGPRQKADPGLEPQLTKAGLDLGPDLLSLKNVRG